MALAPERGDRPPTGARIVLGAGVLLGLVVAASMWIGKRHTLGMNFRVYRAAAGVAGDGAAVYAASPPGFPEHTFLYPPVSLLAFLPFRLVGPRVGFLAFTLLALAVGVALARLLVRVVESAGRPLPTVDRLLVYGFVLASVHTVPSLFYGNVNLHLAAALAFGFVLLERGRERASGVAFGLAALVKLFPAVAGVWLLRRRAGRAVAAAVGTGGGLLLVGVPLFGLDAHRAYVRDALLSRIAADAAAGGLAPGAPYVTLRRPLSVLAPDAPSWALSLAALLALAPVVLALYARVETRLDRLVAAHGTVVGLLLFFPSYLVYLVLLAYPLVPLLYLLPGRRVRLPFVAGALLIGLPVTLARATEVLAAIPVPAGARAALLALLAPVLTLGTPPLYGGLLTLVGCLVYARGRATPSPRD